MPRVVLDALAIVVAAAAAVLALPRGQIAPGGVLDPGPETIVVGALAVGALLVGVLASSALGPRGAATLALGLAASLLAYDVVDTLAAPAAVSSLALVVSATTVPFVVQLVVSFPAGTPRGRVRRWVVGSTWVGVGLVGAARVLVRDPYADARCVLRCESNPWALLPDADLARAMLDLGLVISVVALGWAAALTLRPGRFWPGGTAALILVVEAAYWLVSRGVVDRATAQLLYVAHCTALALLGLAVAAEGIARRRRHRRLRRLAETIDAAPAPGTFAASLAAALGDPDLTIAYAVDSPVSFARVDGTPFDGPRSGQVTTRLVRGGTDIAVIAHRPHDSEAIAEGMGSTARLVIDNERLQAALRSRLAELRASRERIVERAEAERLRLERDVHDGAQQRLLMLGHDVRRAVEVDPDLGSALAPAATDLAAAYDELREVAHGIYPGVLESLGLRAALDGLAEGPDSFTLVEAPDERLPVAVERAAYRVVSTTVRRVDGEAARGAAIEVAARAGSGVLDVRIRGATPLHPQDLEMLEDHVGALGGRMTVDEHLGRALIRAELPCVSS